ncbi:MAG TPA: flavin-dependent oxidoreductase [Hyphomicrobiaceae bacterium]|jgi:2-polyprenyl-6-methoxyphenol hydroxylase-like FAD-dependent oxidoreductase
MGLQVIVIGGGIGGLTLALSLHQAGIAVRVYESVREPAPLGVGINLQPGAVRELIELGLGDVLARTGIATQQLSYFNKHGQLIWTEPRGLQAGYKWPQYSIHRGQLQMLLLRAVQERIGKDNFRSGLRLTTLQQDRNRVSATFIDGESGTAMSDGADILVGADGIHSTVRRHLYPAEGKPRFARQVLWRAAIDAQPFLGGRTMAIAGHFHQRVIAYPVGPGSSPGSLLTNLICQVSVAGEPPGREDWNRRVTKQPVLTAFGQWRFPWLDIPGLIERTRDIYEFPLVDRDPIQAWTFGRVTLIGDAAHPMQPIGSQAGSQAIIDARALTATLLSGSNPLAAMEHYESQRRPTMNDITLRNRRLGPEAALQLVEERAPDGFARIDDVISRQELETISSSFAAAAGLDVEAVNGRQSFVPPARSSP